MSSRTPKKASESKGKLRGAASETEGDSSSSTRPSSAARGTKRKERKESSDDVAGGEGESSEKSERKSRKRTGEASSDPNSLSSAVAAATAAAQEAAKPYSHQQYQLMKLQPSEIKNKAKRQQMWLKVKAAKEDAKSKEKKKRKKDEEAGLPVPPPKKQKTLDNTREADETIVAANDEEVIADENQDEFSKYFSGETEPKIIITSCYKPTKIMYDFIRDLLYVFPNSFYYKRMNFTIQQIVTAAKKRGYTDLLIINEDRKKFNALTHVHLPDGPTAYYKLSNVVLCKDIEGHGRTTSHQPEVILNNFNTRLGHRVGRMLGSLFHQIPDFKGRRVVTFHNQRDFIFFRHHRYIFESKEKACLQQLGPKFTLKLCYLQHGTFDSQHGEMEWIHKKEMDTSRRRFFL